MRNIKLPLITLLIISLFITVATEVSARAEIQGGMEETRGNNAATSGLRPADADEVSKMREMEVEYEGEDEQPGFRPAVMALPEQDEDGMMRKGVPAQLEQRLPIQVQERVSQRNEIREQREEQLRSMDRSERAQERMSDVASSVQELLSLPDRRGGIGQDVREIAKEHQSNLEKIDEDLSDLNSRGGVAKFLWGSDREALESVRSEANQIDARIAQLKDMQLEVNSDEDLIALENLIVDLEGQRNDLLETVQEEQSSQGVFSWMRRLFARGN